MSVANFYSSTVAGLFSQINLLFEEQISFKNLELCAVTVGNGFLNSVLLAFNRFIF
jgi:hypothetical protein